MIEKIKLPRNKHIVLITVLLISITATMTGCWRDDVGLRRVRELDGRVYVNFIEVVGEDTNTTVIFELINNSRHYLHFCGGRSLDRIEYFYEGQWRVLPRGSMDFQDDLRVLHPNSTREVRLWLNNYLPESRRYRIRAVVGIYDWANLANPFGDGRQHDVVAEFYWP